MRLLEGDGNRELSNRGLDWPDDDSVDRWQGDVRLAFFLHYIDFGQDLDTPFGSLGLPDPVPRPTRLRFIKFRLP